MMLECPLKGQLGVLGRKWTFAILRDIGFRGVGRFKDLKQSVGAVTPRILSMRLRQLEMEGLIEKKTLTGTGNNRAWQLTDKGIDLVPLLLGWAAFRMKWDAGRIFVDGRSRSLQDLFDSDAV
jgi:DNA-binding HxlR family transcriptional regulator